MDHDRLKNVLMTSKDAHVAFNDIIVSKRHEDPNINKESIVNNLLLPIAHHETGGTFDPRQLQKVENFNPKVHGHGLYQFERKSLRTALRRSFRFYFDKSKMGYSFDDKESLKKAKVPSWMIKTYFNKNTNASDLDAGQQTALLLYDFLYKDGMNIANVTKDPSTVSSAWFNGHWSKNFMDRSSDEVIDRITSFGKNLKIYNSKYKEKKNRVRHIREVPPNFK